MPNCRPENLRGLYLAHWNAPKVTRTLRGSKHLELAVLPLHACTGHAFLDDRERIVERYDAFAGNLLAKKLRLLRVHRGRGERDVKGTVGELHEFDAVELDGFPGT